MNGPPGAEGVTKYRLKPMPHYAVASLLRVNGDGSRAVSERSLDSSENKARRYPGASYRWETSDKRFELFPTTHDFCETYRLL
jgi:hypothetical protein